MSLEMDPDLELDAPASEKAFATEAVFAAERPRLVGLVYRMTGSVADAEDVVQEAWFRWQRTDTSTIERPAAWLTTVTSRLALDRLRAQRRRREEYVGPWLPEPVRTDVDLSADGPVRDPQLALERTESLELGFLIVLDLLGEVERAVFVLADVFAVPYAEIAEVVDRSPDACRQIASRARRKVRDARGGRRPADEGLLGDLIGAVALGDMQRVIGLLAPEVVLTSDGGPRRNAARRPVVLPERVARLLVNLAARLPQDGELAIEQVNGAAALVARSSEEVLVLTAERDERTGAISRIQMLLNPDKVAGLEHSPLS
ncbi:MAG: RNA polymerase sigma factor SigJ [Microthrixaceae bacterium]